MSCQEAWFATSISGRRFSSAPCTRTFSPSSAQAVRCQSRGMRRRGFTYYAIGRGAGVTAGAGAGGQADGQAGGPR